MSHKSDHHIIEKAIVRFARAYSDLEKLQAVQAKKKPCKSLLPHKGDQKTGLVGEYWAIRYARWFFKGDTVVFGGHSQKGWDLKVTSERRKPRYIQIKTASDFGEGKVSPIGKPSRIKKAGDKREMPNYWDELWFLRLNKSLQPVALWKLKLEHVEFNGKICINGKAMPYRLSDQSGGSDCFTWDKADAVNIRKKLRLD